MNLVNSRNRLVSILAASLLGVMPLLHFLTANAATLSTRSVQVSDSKPSVTNRHLFKFTVPGFDTVGSIQFEYCTNSPLPNTVCTPPDGFSGSSAVLSTQTGETGFAVSPSASPNVVTISRAPTPTSGLPVSYAFDGIVNPSTPGQTVFVRMTTFSAINATGTIVDQGSVVFATVRNLNINGFVPPYIIFCVGVTVDTNCAAASGSSLDFGDLITRNARALTSQYSGATNDVAGYSVTMSGVTMTSGNNIIPPLNPPSTSRPGTSQFGLNLKANSNPGIGAEVSGPGSSVATGGASVANQFSFSNQVISNSPISTDFNKFTATYLVNISSTQKPGIYSTSVTYTASAAF